MTLFGQHIVGALSVRLGGVNASFKVASDSKILAKVPAKGRTGRWSFKTTSGTALSPSRFLVLEPSVY